MKLQQKSYFYATPSLDAKARRDNLKQMKNHKDTASLAGAKTDR
jgi:hypothetical protein